MKKNKKKKGLYDCYSQIVFNLLIAILAIIAFFIWVINLISILTDGVFHRTNKKAINM